MAACFAIGVKLKATLELPIEPVPPAMKALIDLMKEKERKDELR
jgi:hypothetical protein